MEKQTDTSRTDAESHSDVERNNMEGEQHDVDDEDNEDVSPLALTESIEKNASIKCTKCGKKMARRGKEIRNDYGRRTVFFLVLFLWIHFSSFHIKRLTASYVLMFTQDALRRRVSLAAATHNVPLTMKHEKITCGKNTSWREPPTPKNGPRKFGPKPFHPDALRKAIFPTWATVSYCGIFNNTFPMIRGERMPFENLTSEKPDSSIMIVVVGAVLPAVLLLRGRKGVVKDFMIPWRPCI